MGADGGTIAVSRRFTPGAVKDKETPQKVDKTQQNLDLVSSCALSGKPLKGEANIVCCPVGFLFIKEEILTSLFNKTVPDKFNYIKRMKYLSDCILTPSETDSFSFQCPITGAPMNGANKFAVSLSSGKVISVKAIEMTCLENSDSFLTLFPDAAEFDKRVKSRKTTKKRKAKTGPKISGGGMLSKVMKQANENVLDRKDNFEGYSELFNDPNAEKTDEKSLFINGNMRGAQHC